MASRRPTSLLSLLFLALFLLSIASLARAEDETVEVSVDEDDALSGLDGLDGDDSLSGLDGDDAEGAGGLDGAPPSEPEAKPDVPATIDPPGSEGDSGYPAVETPSGALFFDDFQSGLKAWTSASGASGQFKVGQGASPTFKGDRALIIPQKARSYALSAPIEGADHLSDGDFVVQYEVKLEDGMTCGGAYVKLPTDGFPGGEKFNNDVKYSLMFGPDKCGGTSKVHVIFQSLNPVTNEFVEHHLTSPPDVAGVYDKKTHLYSLAVLKDGTVTVSVDGEEKKKGSLSDDFEPPFQPKKEIDDKDDKQPDDWVTQEKIQDPEATKPDDWDEDAPMEIPDEDAKMPEGWLEDEPLQIRDPKAEKPAEWDDEEDGAWEAPMVANPKCEAVGCGEWKRPTKSNPDYKGKWTPPLIDNPAYSGAWSPRKIPNPAYYEVEKPTILPIKAIGFEVWTMDQGVLFDNLLVGTDVEGAKALKAATFDKKVEKEAEAEKKAKEEAEKAADAASKSPSGRAKAALEKLDSALSLLEKGLEPIESLLAKVGAEGVLDKLVDAGIAKPLLLVVSAPLLIVIALIFLLSGGKKSSTASQVANGASTKKNKKKDITSADDVGADGDNVQAAGSEGTGEPTAVRRRRATAE